MQTTIDARLQTAVEKSIEDVRACAVVVLNVNNGDVVAMASRPDFNPSDFIPTLSAGQWKAMVSAEKSPLINRSLSDRNPPGSTFKVITAIAAIRAGVFDAQRVVQCPGYFRVGNMTYSFPRELTAVSFHDAMAYSCNTYFMDLGLRAGRTALISTARDLGVGKKMGFILPGESAGLMPDPEFVKATHKRGMGLGDVANSAIGQGDVLVTPLQMANWMAVIANNGTLYRPRLVSKLEDRNGKLVKSFPAEVLNQVPLPPTARLQLMDGLVAVSEEGTGTAAQIPGIKVASKTGTAQVGSKLVPRQIAWITGYLPADKPLYAFSVMIEGDNDQNLHGGTTAGPIVAQFFKQFYSKPLAQVSRQSETGEKHHLTSTNP